MKTKDLNEPKYSVETDRIDEQDMQFHRIIIKSNGAKKSSCEVNEKSGLKNRSLTFAHKSDKESIEAVFLGLGLPKLPSNFLSCYQYAKTIDLRENFLVTFPTEILCISTLCILRLDKNKISSLPPELGNLSQLKVLTISWNHLKFIDAGLSKLTGLMILGLNDNNICEWPSWICLLPKLQLLHLHGNPHIIHIPTTFSNMNTLTELSFDWIIYLPSFTTCVLKDQQGLVQIEKMKEMCKEFESKGIMSCNFFQFLMRFTKVTKDNLNPVLYYKKRTPFHLAAIHGHYLILNEYLKENINHNVQDNEGTTTFAFSLLNNKPKITYLLMLNNKIDISLAGEKYGSPLHIAILKEQFDIAEKIILHPRLDPNATDINGNTVLHYIFVKFDSKPAAMISLCEKLLKLKNCDLNILNAVQQTPLINAVCNGQNSAIKFALNFNQSKTGGKKFLFDLKREKDGATALHYIAQFASIEVLDLILRANQYNLFIRDKLGRTIKEYASTLTATKLITKYEKLAIQYILSNRNFTESNIDESLTVTTRNIIAKVSEITHNIYNGKGIWRNKVQDDITEVEIPISLEEYETATPGLLESVKRTNIKKEYEDTALKVTEEMHNIPLDLPPFCFYGKSNTINNTNKSRLMQTLNVTSKKGPINIMAATHNIKELDKKLREEMCHSKKLSRNPFIDLYKSLVEEDLPKYQQYKILYYVFSKYLHASDEIFITLIELLPNTNPLKNTIAHMLGLMKSSRSLKVFNKIFDLKGLPLLVFEISNARKLINEPRNFFPIRRQSQVENNKMGNSLFKTQLIGGSTKQYKRKFGGTCKLNYDRKNNCSYTSKRVNYFCS